MTFLKKIVITALCIQILLPNQLLKNIVGLPVLLVHYFQHNHAEKHIHFTDFIADHYSSHQHHEKDHDNHNNLPFHSHGFNFQLSAFHVVLVDIISTVLPTYSEASNKVKIITRQHFHSSTALSSIWRPPKFA